MARYSGLPTALLIPSETRSTKQFSFKTKRTCWVRVQQCFLLYLILLGLVVLVLLWTTSLAEKFLNAVSPFATASKFNLMEEADKVVNGDQEIERFNQSLFTAEYINLHKLQQNHPCVIELIRTDYLNHPLKSHASNSKTKPSIIEQKDYSTAVLRLLNNKVGGFFVVSGALDGGSLSDTEYMEEELGWSGLLLEPDKKVFKTLLGRNRRTSILPVCLSSKPYPTQVSLKLNHEDGRVLYEDKEALNIQCFPLYSILLAVNRTQLEYLSISAGGQELRILKTVPWHKTEIKVLAVESESLADGGTSLERFMKASGYIGLGTIAVPHTKASIFVLDFLADLRPMEALL